MGNTAGRQEMLRPFFFFREELHLILNNKNIRGFHNTCLRLFHVRLIEKEFPVNGPVYDK